MSSTQIFNFQLRQAFIEAIARRIGIQIRDSEYKTLEQKIWQRITALKLDNPNQYYQLLTIPNTDSEDEWQQLAELLTNKESYFFRDRKQLELLKNKIFPQIIRKKRQQGDLELRVWSAGCSTGQEPYSLAIILSELLLDFDAWNLKIFGTDIDLKALSQARAGIYSSWSFRDTEPRIKQQYFEPVAQDYQIVPRIRRMVLFQKINLLTDEFPQLFSDLKNIDLILCRNVFIYFDPKIIGEILEKFYHTLRPSGYLLVGHSELTGQNLSRFQAQIFPQSLIYQRRELSRNSHQNSIWHSAKTQPPFTPTTTIPSTHPVAQPKQFSNRQDPLDKTLPITNSFQLETKNKQELLNLAKELWQQKQSNLAIKKAEEVLALDSQDINAYCLLGKIYFSQQCYALAKTMSNSVLARDSQNLEASYLLIKIALQIGDLMTAKKLLKKILDFDPESIAARVEIGRIYQQEKKRNKARKMRKQALELLQKLPHTLTLDFYNNLTVAQLISQLETDF